MSFEKLGKFKKHFSKFDKILLSLHVKLKTVMINKKLIALIEKFKEN